MKNLFDNFGVNALGVTKREVADGTRGSRGAVEDGQRVVVVGGGLAGVAAACVLAERGVKVTLLEKDPQLGGRVSAWTEHLPDGTPYQMERGFHAFFRQYYQLRSLLRRVDPNLDSLTRLVDYPVLGPDGDVTSFTGLPKTPPLNVVSLLRRTDYFKLRDLIEVDGVQARAMLRFDPRTTYAEEDDRSAGEYLDGLRFPAKARQMLFEVFSHSFFNPEGEMSAAEMLMMFHFYFLGNPEGLVFDCLNDPFSDVLWKPMERYLEGLGVDVALGHEVVGARRVDGGRWRVEVAGGDTFEGDGLVLAVTVPALKGLFGASPDLRADPALVEQVDGLDVTLPFAVWRMFLDKKALPERQPFVGTAGFRHLDNISLYERVENESRRWSLRHGGSVIELHGYALDTEDEKVLKASLWKDTADLYPELRGAQVVHDSWLLRQDCPSFEPGSHARRPRVDTPLGDVVFAGDFVKLPFPTALMERATSAGFLAANHLLDRWDVRGETLYSVPLRGFMAGLNALRSSRGRQRVAPAAE